MRARILFVDSEQSALQGLQRSLHAQRKEWDMVFVDDGREALKMADNDKFDAIVTDIRMPGIDGVLLLESLVRDHPEMIRIILSGHSDEELILRCAGAAHQFLAKPCGTDLLKDTLERAFALKAYLGRGKLQTVVAGLTRLPSIPTVYQEITNKLRSPHTSLREIGEIISKDPAMTAKILQLVNSAFFGLGRRISNTQDAATLIGLDTLKALVLSLGIFYQFDKSLVKDKTFSLDALLSHSIAVAKLAERISQTEGVDKSVSDDCFLAGMLHDIGILILQQSVSEDYVKLNQLMAERGMDLCQAEQEIFGATHGAIGAYLLGLWALPDRVVEAVAFHHQPGLSNGTHFDPLSAVHVADVLIQEHQLSGSLLCIEGCYMDHEFLDRIGAAGRLDSWARLADVGKQHF